jgi:hypothetical protein
METHYIPNIHEFHLGFEFCLCKWEDKNPYRTKIFGRNDKGMLALRHLEQLIDLLKEDKIRVKHLDREDIEIFGFTDYKHSIMDWWSKKGYFDTPGGRHRLTEYKLRYDYKNHELHIEGYFAGESEGILFEGIIDNKSELKKLLTQLRIL